MATALAGGLIASGFTTAKNVWASDTFDSARERFARETGAQAVESNLTVMEHAEVIILSVKPQHVTDVLEEIKGHTPISI